VNLAPYEVGRDGPFGPAEASHLLRRAGFGATPSERAAAVTAGLDATVERLVSALEDEASEGREAARFAALGAGAAVDDELATIQGAWLGRMVHSKAPLAERLALFWHGHFATSIEKVRRGAAMWGQYVLLRERGFGPFRALVEQVARDPAMVVWLDSESNEKSHPNENFARELLELFTLGPSHYDERDVLEAARCFTGWHLKEGRFWLNERAHDAGRKRVLGRDQVLHGDQVIELAADHPACAVFLAEKLAREFVTDAPTQATVAETAAALREERLCLKPFLGRLLRSHLFFAAEHRRARITAPVAWAVSLLRRSGARARWSTLGRTLGEMGQALFAPPNVKGWEGGRAWISSRMLLARGRFAASLAYGDPALGLNVDWNARVGAVADGDGTALVAALADQLLDQEVAATTRESLVAFADSADAGRGRERAARVAHLLLSAPEALLQ
jgi:uncharacterized protein (DUF1800 family)